MLELHSLAVIVWFLAYSLGLAATFSDKLWVYRKSLFSLSALLLGFAGGLYVATRPSIAGVGSLLVALYASVSAIRVVEDRIERRYLRHAARRSILHFMFMQTVVVVLDVILQPNKVSQLLAILMGLSLMVSAYWLYQLVKSLKMTEPKVTFLKKSDSELPSISIAIPARNETDSLAQCIQSIIDSDYPKLEILVLDDCSQDKTAEVIRSFAQDGVRFIQGTEPPEERWLHKNWAYQSLLENASGEYILFMGVDERLTPDSVRKLIALMFDKKLKMLSVLPQRSASKGASSLLQSMRYWWQLALPREALKRPAVLSSCWLVERKSLLKLGGFARATRSIMPEQLIARELSAKNGYRFYRSSDLLGVTSVKDIRSQLNTAVRTRYPQVRHRPERVLLVTIAELVVLLLPFVLAVVGSITKIGIAYWLSIATVSTLVIGNVILTRATNPSAAWLSLVNFPLVAALEIGLVNYSMFEYEFGNVRWKGRNICLPVMRVYKSLPKTQ